jgi:amino acid adenylation domain-containing protein
VAGIASMLAVLARGRPFVPVDPAQPDERARVVLEDSRAPLVVCDARRHERALSLAGSERVVLDVDSLAVPDSADAAIPPVAPDAQATIIYTSGSTGHPKGVLQNHRNVLHNILIHTNALRIAPRDRLTLLSSRGTGQAMTGIFSALLNGAALHPFNLRARGLTELAAWLLEENITIYHSSASVFRELVDSGLGDMKASSLRVVKLGSEPVSRRDVERFRERFPASCVFVNALSSTETGTIRQIVVDASTRIEGDAVPVGYPVPDTEVILLDEAGAEVDRGEIGEICVRSRYLAVGYLNNPELTRQLFVQDAGDPRLRVLHTGDLGRMGKDGLLECLGRRDTRVKVRGNRVEVAEIEAALMASPSIAQAAVVERDDHRGGKRLVAFMVPARGKGTPSVREVRSALGEKLPRHMIPSAFVFLDALPRTASGKVDRPALPAGPPAPKRGGESLLPRDLLETQLADIWQHLLGVDEVGIRDDFFDLGGDSLLAVEMALRVEQAAGVSVALQDMIDELTIERLAAAIVNWEGENGRPPISQLQAGGPARPFIFAHGAIASDGFYCRSLAGGLGPERPFYLLQPHGLDGKPLPRTIEAMADDRLEALLSVQPSGPYLLGGFCAGGAVVFEMARRLRARGERVDLVVLIDTHATNARFRAWSNLVDGIAPVVRLSPEQRSALFRRGRTFLRGLRRASRHGVHEAALFVVKKPYFVLKGAARRESVSPPAPLDPRQAIWLHYHNALEDYVPGRYSGRVVLFRSSHLDGKAPGNFNAGWQHVCDAIEVHAIAGDHRTCVTTHVDELAEKVKACLDGV